MSEREWDTHSEKRRNSCVFRILFPTVATIGQPFSWFIKESYLILGLNRVALFSIYFIVLRMIVWIQWPSVRFGTSRTDCISAQRPAESLSKTLPQHIPHGLHQQNRTDAMPQIHAICCELVDSFSDATKAASALTIYPRSSTVKAIYIAIIDSLGRTIDRFLGCESHRKSLLAYASPNPHAGWGLRQCGQSLNRLVMKPHKLRIISFKGFLIKVLQLGIVMLQ